jgi:uncharacterized protein YbaP (TraB family)
MKFLTHSKILVLFFLFTALLGAHASGMEKFKEEENVNLVVPFKGRQKEQLFDIIPLNVPIVYRGSLKNLLIQKVDYCNNPASLLSKKEFAIVIPRLSYNLYSCILEYKALHLTRHDFIETQTNSSFYSIFHKDRPLYIFILPTYHPLPLEALPTDIGSILLAIAETKESQLIMEILDEEEEEDDDEMLSPPSSAPKLDIESCIQRDLQQFEVAYKPIYQERLGNKLKEQEEYYRNVYEKGWTNKLDVESFNKLLCLSKIINLTIQGINQIDPLYFYYRLNTFLSTDLITANINITHEVLDNRIHNIFSTRNRKIQALETEDDRYEASYEKSRSQWLLAPLEFDIYFDILQQSLKKLPSFEDESQALLYTPSLNDLDFNNPLEMSYLRDEITQDLSISDVAVTERNKNWWKRTLKPLFEERAQSENLHLTPILITYGAGHNLGPFSIIDLIRKMGLEVRRFKK